MAPAPLLRTAPFLLTCLLALSVAGPGAQAHAILVPLAVEHFVLDDEATDMFLVIDGYDVDDLFLREVEYGDLGPGLVFRFAIYGGLLPGSPSQAEHLDIIVPVGDETHTLTLSTSDDVEWTSDVFEFIHVEVEPVDIAYTSSFEVFVSYAQLGVERGDSLGAISMVSRVDDLVVDESPGDNIFGPADPFQQLTPGKGRLVESIELVGPTGYTATTVKATPGGEIAITVSNPFEGQGQHVELDLGTAAGWTFLASGLDARPIDGGKNLTWKLDLHAIRGADPLPLEIRTDLGGVDRIWFVETASGIVATEDPEGVDRGVVEQTTEAPAAPLALLAVLALAMAAAHRRR